MDLDERNLVLDIYVWVNFDADLWSDDGETIVGVLKFSVIKFDGLLD